LSDNPDTSPAATPDAREEALARALAAAHDELAAKIALLETEQAAGALSGPLAAEQARAAQAVYDRDCALARIEAETGWHTWTGIGGVLYARREKSSPPKVVRAADPAGLREQIAGASR
jgi:leucyl aminopeptidase (aminopeptidase T)